jgi:pimeloyl-ACP methyl ester carboxylesterase
MQPPSSGGNEPEPDDPHEARLQLPAGAVRMTVPTPRGALAATAVGMDSAAAWFLFVPGYLSSKEDFYAVMSLLAEQGRGVVAFDLRGQHESGPAKTLQDCSLAAMAADACAVAEQVQSRWSLGPGDLVGHSLGGLVAQRAASQCAWASITLLCSGPAALPAHRAGVFPLIRRFLPLVDRDALWERKLGLERAAGACDVAPAVAEFERARWREYDSIALDEGARILLETGPIDPPAPCPPVRVVWGANDDGWPVEQQRALAVRWNGRTVELPGLGHQPQLDDPVAVARVLVESRSSDATKSGFPGLSGNQE